MKEPIYWIISVFLAGLTSCAAPSDGDEMNDEPVPIVLSPLVEIRTGSEDLMKATVAPTPYPGTEFEINITPKAPEGNTEKYKRYTYQLTATKTGDNWGLTGTSGLPDAATGSGTVDLNGAAPLWAGRTVETTINAWAGWISDFSAAVPLKNTFLDQSTEEQLTKADLLHYRETFIPQDKLGVEMDGKFTFAFHHHLSQLNVKLVFGSEYDQVSTPDNLKRGIRVAGIFNTINSYQFDPDKTMADAVDPGKPSTGNTFPNKTDGADFLENVEYITPCMESPVKDENGHYVVSFKALLVPQELKANTELIIIRMKPLNDARDGFKEDGDVWFIYPLPKTEKLESGKAYTLTLQMGGTVVSTVRNAVNATLQKGDWQ